MENLADILASQWFLRSQVCNFKQAVETLAEAVKKYLDFLEGQQKRTSETHASNEPIRSLEDNWSLHTIEGKKHEPITEKYSSLHESLQSLKEYEPFSLLDIAPANRYNRRHWIDGITLPYPVSLWKYSQGNYLGNLYFIWKIPLNLSDRSDSMNIDTCAAIKQDIPKYSTRQMRKEFVQLYAAFPGMRKSVLRSIWQYITGDSQQQNVQLKKLPMNMY